MVAEVSDENWSFETIEEARALESEETVTFKGFIMCFCSDFFTFLVVFCITEGMKGVNLRLMDEA